MAYVTYKSSRYYGYFRNADGVRKSAGVFNSEVEAMAAAVVMEENIQQAVQQLAQVTLARSARRTETLRAPDPAPQDCDVLEMSYEQYVAGWLAKDEDMDLDEQALLLATTRNYESSLRLHVLPHLGHLKVGEITSKQVRAMIKALGDEGMSPAMKAQCKFAVGSSYNPLVPKYLDRKPTDGVRTPLPPSKPFDLITLDEASRIVNALPRNAQLLVALFMETGGRFGEIFELRPDDLNFRTNTIPFLRRACRIAKRDNNGVGFYVEMGTKAGVSRGRVLKMEQPIMDELKDWIRINHLNGQDLLFPKRLVAPRIMSALGEPVQSVDEHGDSHGTTTGYAKGCRCEQCTLAYTVYRRSKRKSEAKAQDPKTDYVSHGAWHKVWLKAVADSGIGWTPRPHDLRHANATFLLAGGTSLHEVMLRLGHFNISTTQKYLHKVEEMESKASEQASAFLTRKVRYGQDESTVPDNKNK